MTSGNNAVAVLKKIFKHYIAQLESVRDIDPKGNVGLQTCSRQNALETIEEMELVIFPDVVVSRPRIQQPSGDQPMSKYR